MKAQIIAGPPLAGKTTYVERQRQLDDLVLDLDALVAALCGSSQDAHRHHWGAALDARDAIVRRLHRGRDAASGAIAWLITSSPETCAMWERQFGVRAVRLVPPREVIDERLERDNRPPDEIARAVDRWYPAGRV